MSLRVPLLPLLLSIFASPALAGAWTLAEGESQVFVTLRHVEADRFFDGAGRTRDDLDYRKTELSARLEHGLTPAVTAFAEGTLLDKTVEAPGSRDSYLGLDYTELGLRVRLARMAATVLSAQGSVRVPGAGDAGAPAQIGSTDPEADARLLAGHGFAVGPVTGWVDVQGGRRFRAGDPPDEWRLDATLGVRPKPRWMAILQGFGKVATGDADGGFPEARSLDLQGSVAYDVAPGWTVQAGVVATVWGREVGRERGAFVSIWRRF